MHKGDNLCHIQVSQNCTINQQLFSYTLLIYMSHSHSSVIPRNVKRIKWIIIGCTLLGKLDTVSTISNKVLLTMQEKGLLSKSHSKMSDKQSDYVVKKYGLHEVAPSFPFKFWTKIITRELWKETPIRKRKTQ